MRATVQASPLRVAVIVGSTREGRVGDTVGDWFARQARERQSLQVDVVDLLDFALPAQLPSRPTATMVAFADRIRLAEAFVVVTPEYNRSFPASLKQALDCAYDEWRTKPAGFVSYGCHSEGVYAVEQLRASFVEFHVVTMRNGVGVDLLDAQSIDTDRRRQAASTMLDQLTWWGLALRDARAARPYVS